MTGVWLVSYLLLWVVLGLLILVTLALARQIGILHRRIPPIGARTANPGPDIGDEVTQFSLAGLNNSPIAIDRGVVPDSVEL